MSHKSTRVRDHIPTLYADIGANTHDARMRYTGGS